MKKIKFFKNKKKKGAEAICKREDLKDLPLFSPALLDDFRKNVGRFYAETGGMIGFSKDSKLIDLWVFDTTSKNTSGSFRYNELEMTKYYRKWKNSGGTCAGFVHSHPIGYERPSQADMRMSLVLMDFFKNSFFYMPIIQSNKKGFYKLLFYIVKKTDDELILELAYTVRATHTGYEYIRGNKKLQSFPVKDYESRSEAPAPVTPPYLRTDFSDESGSDYFSRLKGFYPDAVLDKVLVYVGCGGVRSEIINMARNGFKNFVLIDGDKVAPTNIATQGVYRPEMGQYKVDAIAKELQCINPDIKTVCVHEMLDDNMSDTEFLSYLKMFPGKESADYLIHGMTDDHNAQVRVAKLAMNFGIPYIGAAMYQFGLGGEVIFTYPGVTASCPRCMLRSRYEAYENGFKNNVTSAGCPTFATERLNTLIGFISLMLLMYKSAPGNPYDNMLDAVADRNYVQIRMSPYLEKVLKIPTFNMAFNGSDSQFIYFDETIWMPQHPDHPDFGEEPCKLCGGQGDIRKLKGKWTDTRKD